MRLKFWTNLTRNYSRNFKIKVNPTIIPNIRILIKKCTLETSMIKSSKPNVIFKWGLAVKNEGTTEEVNNQTGSTLMKKMRMILMKVTMAKILNPQPEIWTYPVTRRSGKSSQKTSPKLKNLKRNIQGLHFLSKNDSQKQSKSKNNKMLLKTIIIIIGDWMKTAKVTKI